MRLLRVIALCLMCGAAGPAWAPQRPGLATGAASGGDTVRQAPGASSGNSEVKELQAPGASGPYGEVMALQAENDRLKRQVELLEQKVKLLEERLRTLEGSK